MSTVCDSCKQTLRQDDGCARIMITDPAPDFQNITAGSLPTFRRPPEIDLCAVCLLKLIAALDLPPNTFTPRPPRAEPTEHVPVGALTEEDLVRLGLKDAP
jgi:hypothetical protein